MITRDPTDDDRPDAATEVTKREGEGRGSNPPSSTTEATRREGAGSVPSSSFTDEEVGAPVKVAYLSRGTLVGRYVVLDVLGEGGMGVVYRAFDPELDRKVAIKLLQTQPGGSSTGEKAWLLREAQALARLSHPNVVAVHDVGALADDRVFIAMELVDGETLRDWLKSKPRTWRDVLPVMLAAGLGLAAAHEAGLVHRDFKPDNVIVGKDGRVRVMDFGLARLRPSDDVPDRRDSDMSVESRSPLSEKLTIAGAVVGTPAYMAPEVYKGEVADARTDQFAFGVALFEALFGTRPYDKRDLAPGASAPSPKPPAETKVPVRIQRVVLRTIAIDHDQRYPSMNDVIAELSIDPHLQRRRWIAASAIVVVAATIGGGVYMMKGSRSALCTGAEHRLAGVWDDKVRQTAKAAFAATKKPFATRSFSGLEQALDQYTNEWTTTVTESCEATRVRGEQTEDVMTLRQDCLDQRLAELYAVTQLLASAEGIVVDKGDKVVWELEPVTRCSNVAALREPRRPPPELRDKIVALETKLADAKAQLIAGRYLPAMVATQAAAAESEKLGYDTIAAEAYMARAGALIATGNSEDAAKSLAGATWAAMRARRDDLVAGAAMSAAMVTSEGLGNSDKAQLWLDLGRAASVRAGIDHNLELQRFEIEGMVAAQAGDLNAAVTWHEKAVATAELVRGKGSPALWSDEQMLATTMTKAGAFAKAASHFEHALALREASVGPDHPDIALILSNLGVCYRHLGQTKKSRAAFERALALREKIYGKNSPMLMATLDNMAELFEQEGDFPTAIAMFDRALAVGSAVFGKNHAAYHNVATDRAQALTASGRLAEARAVFDELLVLEDKAHSPILPQTQVARAELALAEHDWTVATSFAELSIAGYEAVGGKDNPSLWRPLTRLAEAKLGRAPADTAEPRALLERALAIGRKAQMVADDLAPVRAALARLSPP